ncbi:MAG: HD domain-containing protein [Clostridia bacterium]|nr:HD domain-containing protein [Clostridia bacterium]
MSIILEDIKRNEEVEQLILAAQQQLDVLGYTEHGHRHISIVAQRAGEILRTLGYDDDRVRLAEIAGYMHDLGNAINRNNHAHTGAIIAGNILKDMGMDVKERTEIMMAIGNHDEGSGTAVSDISAALILADKSDAHRSRVSKKNMSLFDKHDRVNYAVTDAKLRIDKEERKIVLDLTIDTKMCPVLDYFEIFMERTMMSKYAAKYLGLWFEVVINDTNLL